MYRLIRSLAIKEPTSPGGYDAAIQWAKEITRYIDKHHFPLKLYVPMFGEDIAKIFWFADFDSLDGYHAAIKKTIADKELQKINQQGYEHLTLRSLTNHIFTELPMEGA